MSFTAKKKLKRSIHKGGLEGSLDTGGYVVYVSGLLAGVWFLIVGEGNGIFPAIFVYVFLVLWISVGDASAG